MHPVLLIDGETELLKQAKEERDWTILPNWKLRYLYQRLVALPGGDVKTVKLIGRKAAIKLGKIETEKTVELTRNVRDAFGIRD